MVGFSFNIYESGQPTLVSHFKATFRQFFGALFCILQNFEPTLVNLCAIGQFFIALNDCILIIIFPSSHTEGGKHLCLKRGLISL